AFASTISTSGDAHTDFEIFRTIPVFDVNSNAVFNGGPDSGHTAGVFWYNSGNAFQPDGSVKAPGDVIIAVDYVSGGQNPEASVRVWVNPNDVDGNGHDTAWLNQQVARPFTFTGVFDSGTD